MAVSPKEIEFNFNEDKMRLKIRALEKELEKVHLGGGKKRIGIVGGEEQERGEQRQGETHHRGARTRQGGGGEGTTRGGSEREERVDTVHEDEL